MKQIAHFGHGKIQRRLTYAMYESDIGEVYKVANNASENFEFSNLPRLDISNEPNITYWLVHDCWRPRPGHASRSLLSALWIPYRP